MEKWNASATRSSAYHIRRAATRACAAQTDHRPLPDAIDRETPWEEIWRAMETWCATGR